MVQHGVAAVNMRHVFLRGGGSGGEGGSCVFAKGNMGAVSVPGIALITDPMERRPQGDDKRNT